MKQRFISSAVGLILLAVVLALFDTIVVNIVVALLAWLAVYEMFSATGCWNFRPLSIPATIFAIAIPFLSSRLLSRVIPLTCYLYVLVLFSVLLRNHKKIHVEQVAVVFTFSLMIPFSLSTLVYQRDWNGTTLGIFYVLLSLGSAWLSDTGAYFAGHAFGKHKLAPVISPKKTVEGAIGGMIFADFAMLMISWMYSLASAAAGYPIQIHYLAIACIMPFLSAVSIVGDLSASILKRQFGVKDYGSIMPGHGGVMDRFDSALMVAPLVYIISRYLPLAVLA